MDTISRRCYRVNRMWTEVLLTLQIYNFFSVYKTIFLVKLNTDAAIYIAFVGRDELVLVKISVTASKHISVSDLKLFQ